MNINLNNIAGRQNINMFGAAGETKTAKAKNTGKALKPRSVDFDLKGDKNWRGETIKRNWFGTTITSANLEISTQSDGKSAIDFRAEIAYSSDLSYAEDTFHYIMKYDPKKKEYKFSKYDLSAYQCEKAIFAGHDIIPIEGKGITFRRGKISSGEKKELIKIVNCAIADANIKNDKQSVEILQHVRDGIPGLY